MHHPTPVRTGQAHRTLIGHMGPVTCLQFDESYIISGSLDRTIRVSLDARWFNDVSVESSDTIGVR